MPEKISTSSITEAAKLKRTGKVAAPATTDAKPLPTLNTTSAPKQIAQKPISVSQVKSGQNMAGQTVKLNDGSNYTLQGASSAGKPEQTTAPNSPILHNPAQGSPLTNPAYQEQQIKPAGNATQAANKTKQVQPTSTEQVDAKAQNGQTQADKYLNEVDALKEAEISGEEGYRDALIDSAEARYSAEQSNLDNIQAIQNKTLEDRNAALERGAEIERKAAKDAFEASKASLEIQAERTKRAYEDKILEQKSQNTQRILQTESQIAATGGFGSFTRNKEVMEMTVKNDRVLNELVFQKESAGLEIANKIVAVSADYSNNIARIENDKQTGIQTNYDKYLEYVEKISNDRELSQVEKQTAIKDAQEQYKQNVAKINHDAFNTRYEISQKAAAEARQIQKDEKDDAREVLEKILNAYALNDQELTAEQQKQIVDLEVKAGFPGGSGLTQIKALKEQARRENLDIQSTTDNFGNVTYFAVDKITGKVVNQTTLKGIAQRVTYQMTTDPITGETVVFDSASGKVITNGTDLNTQSYYNKSIPAGYNGVGSTVVKSNDFKQIFKVGQNVGLWCGEYASTISTGPKVGDTWTEKVKRIAKRDNPMPGNKLLLPLGVKSDGSGWGHVAVVVDYDAKTGNITVVESNKDGTKRAYGDGKGTVTMGTYNLNELKKNYGNNFGFTEGELKPGIQKQLETAKVPFETTASQSDVDGNDLGSIVNKLLASGLPRKQAYDTAQDIIQKKLEAEYTPQESEIYNQIDVADAVSKGYKTESQLKQYKAIVESGQMPPNLVNTKPLTQDQANSKTFADRLQQAEDIFTTLENEGYDFSNAKYIGERSVPTSIAGFSTGGFGKSSEIKRQEQAERNFINAVLRKESGASISASEFDNAKLQYFPQPGDTPEVLAQKKENRRIAIEGMKNAAGPTYTSALPTGMSDADIYASVTAGGGFDQADVDFYNNLQ